MTTKTITTASIAILITIATLVASAGPQNRKPLPPIVSYGSVVFTNNQLTALGEGFTVTRQGIGVYTITYTRPFSQVPKLVIDPTPANELFATHFDSRVPTQAKPGCLVSNASATGATITCVLGVDPTSRECVEVTDQFGNLVAICDYTRVLANDLPFNFAAFE